MFLVLDVLRAEGFSCSLGVLYGGLGIEIKFPAINFFNFRSSTLYPSGSAIRKNAGSGSVSGSALNQCGSETLEDGRASSMGCRTRIGCWTRRRLQGEENSLQDGRDRMQER
jgi:hypothetical protein